MNNEEYLSIKQIEKLIEEKVKLAKKEEVFEVYDDLFKNIWNILVHTLGSFISKTIMKRAVAITIERYGFISKLEIDGGVNLSKLKSTIDEEEYEHVKEAFKELIINLVNVLASLTGEIMVREILKNLDRD
ncbi:MAG: hypothetical protein ACTSQE_15320 [Candidatus Heimdallarchaeaceae archaeon]